MGTEFDPRCDQVHGGLDPDFLPHGLEEIFFREPDAFEHPVVDVVAEHVTVGQLFGEREEFAGLGSDLTCLGRSRTAGSHLRALHHEHGLLHQSRLVTSSTGETLDIGSDRVVIDLDLQPIRLATEQFAQDHVVSSRGAVPEADTDVKAVLHRTAESGNDRIDGRDQELRHQRASPLELVEIAFRQCVLADSHRHYRRDHRIADNSHRGTEQSTGYHAGDRSIQDPLSAEDQLDSGLIRDSRFPGPGGSGDIATAGNTPKGKSHRTCSTDKDGIRKSNVFHPQTHGHDGATDPPPQAIFHRLATAGLDCPGQSGTQQRQQEDREAFDLAGVLCQLHQRIENDERRHRESDEDNHHDAGVFTEKTEWRGH